MEKFLQLLTTVTQQPLGCCKKYPFKCRKHVNESETLIRVRIYFPKNNKKDVKTTRARVPLIAEA